MKIEGEWLIGGPDPEPGTYNGKTAAQWREKAQRSTQRSRESFECSDTDGALSQLAHDTSARKSELCAQVAERNGTWEFPGLFDLDGNLVNAMWIRTAYGYGFVLRDHPDGTAPVKRFFNPSIARKGVTRRRNDRAKGFMVGTIRTRAEVRAGGGGKGLAGVTSVYFYVARVDNSPIEIIDNGSLGTRYTDDER